MTETILIKGCLKKDEECQRLLFEKYAGKMMSLCLRFTDNEHEAQDILQEGFIIIFDCIDQYKFEGSIEAWMKIIFVRIATRHIQKRKLYFEDIDISDHSSTSVDPSVISKFTEADIHQLIRSLPDGYRVIFNLHIIEGYSHVEIAAMLGIQSATSRTQLLKARKMLQAIILKQYKAITI